MVNTLLQTATLAAVLWILFRQENTVMDDLETLNTEVDEIAADEAAIKTDVATVIAELKEAQAKAAEVATTIDLSGPIAKLQAIHTALSADDASLQAEEPTTEAPLPTDGTGDAPGTGSTTS